MNIDLEKLAKYFADKGPVVLLESQSTDHPWSRTSYLAAMPQAEITARDDDINILKNGIRKRETGNPWQALLSFRKEQDGWLFGYLGYDLKNYIEDLASANPDPVNAPDLYFMNPGFLMEFDRQSGMANVLKGRLPQEKEYRSSRSEKHFDLNNFRPQIAKKDYLDRIREIQQGIAEGDYYEINLSHQMKGDFTGDPLGLYHQMKRSGPVPFGGFLQVGDITICCQSPERFLAKDGRTVFSQPIKGTSQRGEDSGEDETLKQRLVSSPKERAENLMIVDLVRNDLSRIARRGSVEVPELFSIQSFDTVHQMVSTVTAETDEKDPFRILKTCFPMGSMTGAPKISAMKTIEDLEGYRRGIYSGAIGYITPEDDFDFNVVIRTAIIRDHTLFYSVGGAVTSDSDPQKEWDETLIKARALEGALTKKHQLDI